MKHPNIIDKIVFILIYRKGKITEIQEQAFACGSVLKLEPPGLYSEPTCLLYELSTGLMTFPGLYDKLHTGEKPRNRHRV
jgi:hypothetical protein